MVKMIRYLEQCLWDDEIFYHEFKVLGIWHDVSGLVFGM